MRGHGTWAELNLSLLMQDDSKGITNCACETLQKFLTAYVLEEGCVCHLF